VDEVEGPLGLAQEDDGLDLTDRCWLDKIDHIWMTDFPPPAGFTGYQSRPYNADEPYTAPAPRRKSRSSPPTPPAAAPPSAPRTRR